MVTRQWTLTWTSTEWLVVVSRLSSTLWWRRTSRWAGRDWAGRATIESNDVVWDEVALTVTDPDVVASVDVPLTSIEPGVTNEESVVELAHLRSLQARREDIRDGTSPLSSIILSYRLFHKTFHSG